MRQETALISKTCSCFFYAPMQVFATLFLSTFAKKYESPGIRAFFQITKTCVLCAHD